MTFFSTKTPTGQPASLGNEWCDVLEVAASHGLTDPHETQRLQGDYLVSNVDAAGLESRVFRLLADGPAATKALDAISKFFAPGDVIELRALSVSGTGPASLCGRLDDPAERQALEAFIRDHIGQRNLYVGINPRRADMAGTARSASAPDVAQRRAVVLDLDFKDAPAADPDWENTLDAIQTELDPGLVVQTGNGVHVWLEVEPTSGADLDASRVAIKDAMDRIGSDDMSDLPRIIRLPYTVNLPNSGKRQRGAKVRLAVPDSTVHPASTSASVTVPRVTDLCRTLEGIAQRLGLPGRQGAGTSSAASVAGGKTGWPAPSADILRMALEELPNTLGGRFDNRGDWVNMAHAIKGAAVAAGIEAEGREAFIQWSQQWGGDPDEPERVWDSIGQPHSGWGAVMRTLEQVNPAGAQQVKEAELRAAFGVQAAQNVAALSAVPIQPVLALAPAQIPPREWLYGRVYIRGFISALVAPGGSGKSALTMVEAVAMATGRELLSGEKVANRPLTVWYHNGEDSVDEQNRRLLAVMLQHKVSQADLGGRLILTSGHDVPIKLGQMGRNGPETTPATADWIVGEAKRLGVDVLILDPMGAVHTLPENSNEAMNLLAAELRQIAKRANIAIGLVHHTSKAAAMDMDAAGAGASRGASAITDAARSVRQIVRMTPAEAGRFGVQPGDRRDFMRVENGKANLTRAEDARWIRIVSVNLGNGTPDYPSGDSVQTCERWTPPTSQTGTAADLARVQTALLASPRPPRADHRSPEWVGWLVARVMGLDMGCPTTSAADRTPAQAAVLARVRAMVDEWVRIGALEVRTELDTDSRKKRPFVYAGTPAVVLDADPADSPSDKDAAENVE